MKERRKIPRTDIRTHELKTATTQWQNKNKTTKTHTTVHTKKQQKTAKTKLSNTIEPIQKLWLI